MAADCAGPAVTNCFNAQYVVGSLNVVDSDGGGLEFKDAPGSDEAIPVRSVSPAAWLPWRRPAGNGRRAAPSRAPFSGAPARAGPRSRSYSGRRVSVKVPWSKRLRYRATNVSRVA